MQAIIELQKEGYQVSLDGENIRCQKMEGANPDPEKVHLLFKKIRENKAQAVKFLTCLHCKHLVEFDRRIFEHITKESYRYCQLKDLGRFGTNSACQNFDARYLH